MSFGLFANGVYTDLHEPEDARLTGGTRSLSRRLLGLNLPSTPVDVQMSSSSPGSSVDTRRSKATKKSGPKVGLSKPMATT